MLKLLGDENFDNTVVRGIFRRSSEIDILRVQDVGLSGKDDPTILEWGIMREPQLLVLDEPTEGIQLSIILEVDFF